MVVVIPEHAVSPLMAAFPPPRFHLERDQLLEAIKAKSMFNLLNVTEGDKVDFWMLSDEPFDVACFKRRKKVSALGMDLFVSSPEDTILAKLRWAKLSGGSEKQLRDCVRVYEVQYDTLDAKYLRDWVERLGVSDYWERLLNEVKP